MKIRKMSFFIETLFDLYKSNKTLQCEYYFLNIIIFDFIK